MFEFVSTKPSCYYTFTSNANDISGNGYNAALYGGASANDTLLIENNANDFAVLPYELISGLTDFTVSFKVKFNSLHSLGTDPLNTIIEGIGAGNYLDELVLAYENNSSAFKVTIKNTTVSFPFYADEGEWYCIYVIRNDSEIAVFVDGLQAGNVQQCPTGPLVVSAFGFPCILGQKKDTLTYSFDGSRCLAGKLDELKFYDFAFTAQQVTEECASCTDRASYSFTFDASDDSWNNLDGSLHGNAVVSNGVLTLGDNTTDYVTIPDATLNGLQDFDISFKVKFDVLHDTGSLPVNTILHMWGLDWGTHAFRISVNASTNVLKVRFYGNEFQYTFIPSQDQWYCMHVQRSSDSLMVYVNAQLIGTSHIGNAALIVSPDNIVIGQLQNCPGGCFQENQSLAGSLDYFKISNCALPVPSDETCINTSVMSIPNQDSFSIFPNPADAFVKINFPQSKKVTASVFNMLGEEVVQMISTNPNELILPTKNLLPGIYLLELRDGNRNFSQMLVVNH